MEAYGREGKRCKLPKSMLPELLAGWTTGHRPELVKVGPFPFVVWWARPTEYKNDELNWSQPFFFLIGADWFPEDLAGYEVEEIGDELFASVRLKLKDGEPLTFYLPPIIDRHVGAIYPLPFIKVQNRFMKEGDLLGTQTRPL
jgi:hypothetical protein